jgi:hypothetical protein
MATNKSPGEIMYEMSEVILETLARIETDPRADTSTKSEIAYCRRRLTAIYER